MNVNMRTVMYETIAVHSYMFRRHTVNVYVYYIYV